MEGPAGDSRVQSPIWTGSLEGGREQIEWRSRVVVIYGLAVFTSAFLIFLVQPMVGKRILPWFGGVPAVWTICLAFYQTTLFLGYAYAHLSTRLLRPSLQLGLHALFVLGALASLPILPEAPGHPIEDTDPTATVLAILAGSVGLPFLVLASTGPLVQVWLARTHPSISPYPLYAISNFGSFLALFAYPFWIESNLRNSTEARVWTLGFGLTCLIVLACAIPAVRSARTLDPVLEPEDRVDAPDSSSAADALMWLALSAVAVVVLMGVTNKLCLDVASFPLLWILPLATYLATFMIAFSSERTYRRVPFALLAVASLAVTRALSLDDWIAYQILAYCVLLFSICMLLHGELYRSRPSPRLLTRFYLCVSAGGALGGLFVGLVAPRIFDDYLELPVGIVATAFLLLFLCARDPRSALVRGEVALAAGRSRGRRDRGFRATRLGRGGGGPGPDREAALVLRRARGERGHGAG